jgi:hypothetical protein
MPDPTKPGEAALPASLEGHTIPEQRLAAIRPLVADLSRAMLAVSQTLPFQADAADFVRVLETEGDR